MLQRERTEDLQRLLKNHHKHEKGEADLGGCFDITPVHLSLDSPLGTLFLTETTRRGLSCLGCDRRKDCPAEALLSAEFFSKCVYLFIGQSAVLCATGTIGRCRTFAIPERC
jgi:hypothetical protein